jgi:hypothetical protein
MGGDTSGKTSSTTANTAQNTSQDVWGTQTPFMEQLYGQGQALSQDPRYTQTAEQLAGQVTDPLMGGYQQAFGPESAYGQAAAGVTDPMIQGLTQLATADPSQAFGAGGVNPLLDKNVAMALEQASQNFQRNVLPGIRGEAIGAGQYGGSRGEIAEGLAASDANRQALQAAMGAYGDQYAMDRAANLQSQAMMGQTALGAAGQMGDILGAQQTGVGQGVQAGQGLYNLGMGGQQAGWDQLGQYANILGGPTVLGTSTATGVSGSEPIMGFKEALTGGLSSF